MARALRSDIYDPDVIGVYHCFNRVVRRSFLCGFDPLSKRDYSYRRDWFYCRLKYLAEHFAIDVLGYAVLSNHYHLVLRNRPDQVRKMSDEEVVRAWLRICPRRKRSDGTADEPNKAEVRYEMHRPGRVAKLRKRLSNPSWLIRQLAQYMGIRCNAEDQVTGHFWESRFGMRRLLDEAAVLACMAYVDLNPIRAGLVESLEGYEHVSIGQRLRTLDEQAVDASRWLAPLELTRPGSGRQSRQGLAESLAAHPQGSLGCLPMSLEEYAELLRWLARFDAGNHSERTSGEPPILQRLQLDPIQFADVVTHFAKRFFTSVGCPASMEAEARRRGRRRLNGKRISRSQFSIAS